jgi:Adenylate and Guanylate cyclase catalytic domain
LVFGIAASRMESTGEVGRIHVSTSTAELLKAAGKGRWVTERDELVQAKGKGSMRTFWLNHSPNKSDNKGSSDNESTSPSDISQGEKLTPDPADMELIKRSRLVDWIVELLSEHIKNLVRLTHSQELKLIQNYRGTHYFSLLLYVKEA